MDATGSQKSESRATRKKGQIKFFHLKLLFSSPHSWDEEKIKFISKVFISIYQRGCKKRKGVWLWDIERKTNTARKNIETVNKNLALSNLKVFLSHGDFFFLLLSSSRQRKRRKSLWARVNQKLKIPKTSLRLIGCEIYRN